MVSRRYRNNETKSSDCLSQKDSHYRIGSQPHTFTFHLDKTLAGGCDIVDQNYIFSLNIFGMENEIGKFIIPVLPFSCSRSSLIQIARKPSATFRRRDKRLQKRAKRAIFRSRVAAGIGIRIGSFISLKNGMRPIQSEKILASKGAAFSLPSLKRNTKLLTFFDIGSVLWFWLDNNRGYKNIMYRRTAPCL